MRAERSRERHYVDRTCTQLLMRPRGIDRASQERANETELEGMDGTSRMSVIRLAIERAGQLHFPTS